MSNNLFKGYQPRAKQETSKHAATKSTSFKEPKLSQTIRGFNKTVEKPSVNRGSIGDNASPNCKRVESGKKVNKVSSQELLKGPGTYGVGQPGADKKGAKHLYMSLNKDSCKTGKNSKRDKSVSSDNHYLKHTLTGGKVRDKNQTAHNQKKHRGGAAGSDYEIVFDHMNEDSMPESASYDLEEQPTVMLVEEMHPHEVLAHSSSTNNTAITTHKSKERNASLLNASSLGREQQIVQQQFSRSIGPESSGVARTNTKDARTLQAELPKLGKADSKLFRQSIGMTTQDSHQVQANTTKSGAVLLSGGAAAPGSSGVKDSNGKGSKKKAAQAKPKQNTLFMGQQPHH